MPTVDMSPHAVEVGAKQKKNRYAFIINSFVTIAFALIAGTKVDRGVQHFRAGSDWQLDAFMCLIYLVISIVWVSRLRIKRGEDA